MLCNYYHKCNTMCSVGRVRTNVANLANSRETRLSRPKKSPFSKPRDCRSPQRNFIESPTIARASWLIDRSRNCQSVMVDWQISQLPERHDWLTSHCLEGSSGWVKKMSCGSWELSHDKKWRRKTFWVFSLSGCSGNSFLVSVLRELKSRSWHHDILLERPSRFWLGFKTLSDNVH